MFERDISHGRLSRRQLLKQIARAGTAIPVLGLTTLPALQAWSKQTASSAQPLNGKHFSDSDDMFLDELEKASFQYFWEQAHPETGIVLDRCHARDPVTSDLGSIAATGFGLTALCIGEKRGFVPRWAAEVRALNTLRFLWKRLRRHWMFRK